MLDLTFYVQKIRERLILSDLIRQDVKLTRKGHEFSGLCPFHSERTPSFTINDQKGFYHCFGCGAHGDAISYLTQRRNLSFQEAVSQLCDSIGIKIEEVAAQSSIPVEMYNILEHACNWFQKNLDQSSGEKARIYLKNRISDDSIQQQFRIGYAPDLYKEKDSLFKSLIAKGFNKSLVLQSGVVIQSNKNEEIYDRFRGRLMFPILDKKNRVIAFGGRILGQSTQNQAKYLNSADTVLFHKGQILYNFYQASLHINSETPPILVEGYFDVIALHKAGWKTAVAPLGTAVTEHQLNLLWRRHSCPILCFDGDQAGHRAVFRTIKRALPFLKPAHSLRIFYLPSGEDPDSLMTSQGPQALRNIFKESRNLVDALWDYLLSSYPSLSTPEAKAQFKRNVLEITQVIQDNDVRKFYEIDFSQRIKKFLYNQNYPSTSNSSTVRQQKTSFPLFTNLLNKKNKLAHKILLVTLINHPTLIKEVFEQFASLDFQDEVWQDLKQLILNNPHEETTSLREKIESKGYGLILNDLCGKELYQQAPFCTPNSDPLIALEYWQEIWSHTVWKESIIHDLKQAQADTKNSLNDKDWQKMRALKNSLIN